MTVFLPREGSPLLDEYLIGDSQRRCRVRSIARLREPAASEAHLPGCLDVGNMKICLPSIPPRPPAGNYPIGESYSAAFLVSRVRCVRKTCFVLPSPSLPVCCPSMRRNIILFVMLDYFPSLSPSLSLLCSPAIAVYSLRSSQDYRSSRGDPRRIDSRSRLFIDASGARSIPVRPSRFPCPFVVHPL